MSGTEKLSLTLSNTTIASLDVEDMYPSIKYRLVLSAINFYSERFNEEEMQRIDAALEMLKFSMRNTIISFADKYYECGTSDDPMERGLTIGGYESAWLADLVARYVLGKAKDRFADTHYFGIYRDDGCVVFKGPRETEELTTWLEDFQREVNDITESDDDIVFTMSIWKPGGEKEVIPGGKIDVCVEPQLPYLDTELSWNEDQALCFECHSKPDFEYKYLNKDSFHTSNCKEAVPCGVAI